MDLKKLEEQYDSFWQGFVVQDFESGHLKKRMKQFLLETITQIIVSDWEKELKQNLEDVIEDMEAYIEKDDNLSYSDELFKRLLKQQTNFISDLLAKQEERVRSEILRQLLR